MHVVVVGGGIAGLGAAWELRGQGAEVTLLERQEEVGGRCRSFRWHGQWLIGGAFAFGRFDENIVTLATALGIYRPQDITDMTGAHVEHILYQRSRVLTIDAMTLGGICRMPGIPVREKLGLARVLPKAIAQRWRHDPGDPTCAAPLDAVTACAYFRRSSPTFVDYVLEPTLQMFCGYAEDDYSLGWLLWSMGGTGAKTAAGWWTFTGKGVGQLTRSLGDRLQADAGCDLRPGAECREIRFSNRGVEIDSEQEGTASTIRADAAVVAVPGSMVTPLMPGLDPARRHFFEHIGYVGHHIVYYLVDMPSATPWGRKIPGMTADNVGLMLPTADGFRSVSNLNFRQLSDQQTLVYGELKGRRCAELREASDDEILRDAWQEVLAAAPGTATCVVRDQRLERNDIGLCRREVGHLRRLADFKALGPLKRVAFAGDYLINSTVGRSLHSGTEAARRILALANA